MHVNFISNKQTELNRYLLSCRQLFNGDYGNRIFYVSDKIPFSNNYKYVVIPFNEALLDSEINGNIFTVEGLLDEISQLHFPKGMFDIFDNFEPVSETEISKIRNEWIKVERRFEELIKVDFDNEMKINDKFNVVLTKIGSSSSFSRLFPNKPMQITVRTDIGTPGIAEAIITSYVTYIRNKNLAHIGKDLTKSTEWFVVEGISDYIMQTREMKKLFPSFLPTLDSFRIDIKSEEYQRSLEYMKKLGLNLESPLLITEDSIINTRTGEPIQGLNDQEETILKLLIQSPNTVITYEEIAKALWRDNYFNKFSLNSINKTIHSLRLKFRLNNVLNSYISTIRRKGYIYNSPN